MVKLFVEGGGDNDALKSECREGFSKLLVRANVKGRMPRIVACGSRGKAFAQFCTAIRSNEPALLLVDAEAPVTSAAAWDHVAQRSGDKWEKPDDATEDHLHLMVQCMETWFLADREALQKFFGQGFNENGLPPATANIEAIGKAALFDHLRRATRETKTKGAYGKGPHSFKLLAMLDPARVRSASPWAERFFTTLGRALTSSS